MKKFNELNNKRIHELVNVVKKGGESNDDAFLELFSYFEPLIKSFKLIYQIDDFDDDDWVQEAAIVCYKACISFDGSLGSRFPSYYKLLLRNHLISLIRKQESYKRKGNKKKSL